MNIKVQVIIEYENNTSPIVEEIACFKRSDLSVGTVGLMLQESKELLTNLQQSMVEHQIGDHFIPGANGL